MMELVPIVEEPTGQTYLALLHFAVKHSTLFSLVWRDQLDFGPAAIAVADKLRPNLVSERYTDEWPGTQLFGHSATVRFYRMSPAAMPTLAEAERLYAWTAPERPEDLAFYVSADNPWLGSISHEQEAFVYRNAVDLQKLSADVHGLKLEPVTRKRAR
jgi:hypothetical protein